MAQLDYAEAQKRLNTSENDLLAMLGADLTSKQALPLQPAQLIERGQRWLMAQYSDLQSFVCASDNIKTFALAKNDDAEIVVEIAKLIAGIVLPVNPIIVSVLIVKRGLKSFCESSWSEQ